MAECVGEGGGGKQGKGGGSEAIAQPWHLGFRSGKVSQVVRNGQLRSTRSSPLDRTARESLRATGYRGAPWHRPKVHALACSQLPAVCLCVFNNNFIFT
jgi:hypothetical protein